MLRRLQLASLVLVNLANGETYLYVSRMRS
jgi:hypothetical protein